MYREKEREIKNEIERNKHIQIFLFGYVRACGARFLAGFITFFLV